MTDYLIFTGNKYSVNIGIQVSLEIASLKKETRKPKENVRYDVK